DVPAGNFEILHLCQRNEIPDRRRATSVRFPSRTVPNCVSEPIGFPRPRLKASSPAIKVVVTAPIPGISTPSFPSGGAIRTASLLGNRILLGGQNAIIPTPCVTARRQLSLRLS